MSYRVKSVRKTCEACPAQWEGELEDGRPFYVRFRFGWLFVAVGERGMDKFGVADAPRIFDAMHGHAMDGEMEWWMVLELTPLERGDSMEDTVPG